MRIRIRIRANGTRRATTTRRGKGRGNESRRCPRGGGAGRGVRRRLGRSVVAVAGRDAHGHGASRTAAGEPRRGRGRHAGQGHLPRELPLRHRDRGLPGRHGLPDRSRRAVRGPRLRLVPVDHDAAHPRQPAALHVERAADRGTRLLRALRAGSRSRRRPGRRRARQPVGAPVDRVEPHLPEPHVLGEHARERTASRTTTASSRR
jgi:hypothetical protein